MQLYGIIHHSLIDIRHLVFKTGLQENRGGFQSTCLVRLGSLPAGRQVPSGGEEITRPHLAGTQETPRIFLQP